MARIQCLKCPHEIFYSEKSPFGLRCAKCKSTYKWVGEKITLLLSGDIIEHRDAQKTVLADEKAQRIEYYKSTGDASSLLDSDIQNLIAEIVLTTGYTVANRDIDFEIEIITAECVYGLHLFKDMFASIRDGRKTVLFELRREAFSVNADAVIGVDLDYQEISGGGKGMLMLVANGTAVRLKQ